MNQDFIIALLRTMLQMAGASLAAKGVVSDEQWAAISGGALAAASVLWMLWARYNTKVVPAQPAALNASPPTLSAHAWLGVPLAAALVLSGLLAGCASASLPSPAASNAALQTALAVGRSVAPSSVAKLDQSISQVAGSPTLAKSCAVFAVAVGYYDALRGAIPAKYSSVGDLASKAGTDLCANPPADTGQALAALNRLWAGVQASTVTK